MAVIKCKMCGGDLILAEGQSVAECEYCGSRQTVPTADNEKKLNLFASANKLRLNCEFDRAAGVYDAIKAEFPSEAEAYWGLVLCKYGIEYVDDPATGKKVPTCHRLSYDSVMDDANVDLSVEYADSAARKVYREEAKHLEKIREGILEVSSNEKPYDIFICYKETDENGDRTLDSVLAQDIYGALTDKGYRVFFSRITLRSKLGEAYEPYIFAALNSAKVMLAISTDPEYYSAVWVKNEWSRYLKICAADKSKHLIPCYKDMDAYDMPREFRPLQGVDLGKMGAVQDILFNMEKYIPLKKQNTTVIQEKVVVGGTGGSNKIASLLDRGNMALEDGDWAKADSFFEDVLNNDSKNAQAYLGKTLAQERCRTMDALVRKRKDVYQNVGSEKLYIQEKSAHITAMTEQYSLPGYVEQHTIRELYRFELSYNSEVSGRQKQYREEEAWWASHKLLSRAEKFAVGAVAEHLKSEKNHLFAQLADRVKKAQEADARSVAKLDAAYDAHIAEADKQAVGLYQDGCYSREANYRGWLEQAKRETNPHILSKLEILFEGLGDFKDSKNLAEHCRKRAAEEQAKLDAEAQWQSVIAEQKKKAQQKQNKKLALVAVVIAVVISAVAIVVNQVIIPPRNYADAKALLAEGEYTAAAQAFDKLGDYLDSPEQKTIAEQKEEERLLKEQMETDYQTAMEAYESGEYEKAQRLFEALADYKNCRDLVTESQYQYAISLLKYGFDADPEEIREAHDLLQNMREYKDAEQYLSQIYTKIISCNTKQGIRELEDEWRYNEYGCRSYYDEETGEEQYKFNEQGQLVSDMQYHYEYDVQGNIARKYNSDETHVYTYDSYGNVLTDTFETGKSGSAGTHRSSGTNKHSNKYENGLLVKKTVDSYNPLEYVYEYDAEGRLIKEIERQYLGSKINVTRHEYVYDDSGRLTQSVFAPYYSGIHDYRTYIYGYVWVPKQAQVQSRNAE